MGRRGEMGGKEGKAERKIGGEGRERGERDQENLCSIRYQL